MAFVEEPLDLGILYGTQGGRGFNTEILTNAGGTEQRIIRWREPKGRWLLGNKRLTETELNYLHNFFQARKGSYEGFRFKDWSDFEVNNGFIATGNGINTRFQLIKLYGSARRVITKPIASTLTVFLDGATTTNYSLDFSTGVITFDTPPSNSVTITATFEFDVPVRFEQDNFKSRFLAYSDINERIHELADLSVVEIRIPRETGIVTHTPSVDFNALQSDSFNLNRYSAVQAIIYGTVGGAEYSTTINPVDNGFERREISWEGKRPRFNLGDFVLNKTEWEYLQQFFYERFGRGGTFLFSDYGYKNNSQFLARFDQDNLEVRFDGYDPHDGEKLFYLSGLQIVAATPIPEEINPLSAPDTTQFYFIIDTTSIEQLQVDAINQAVNNLKPILRDEVFGGDQALADSNITVIESRNAYGAGNPNNEAWMLWFNDYYATEAYYFFWMDESRPLYHTESDTSPTPEWNNHFNTFDANFNSRNFFACRIYHVPRITGFTESFAKHIQEAYFGINGYTAVKDYDIFLRLKVDATQLTADDYYNDFTGQVTLGIAPSSYIRGYKGLSNIILSQATCWLIQRKDGTTLGFTNHDEDIEIDGVVYRAETGISPTATTRKANLTQDNTKIDSILDSEAITKTDLIAGKYEEATVTQASVDWLNPPATLEDGIILLKGKTGEIETTQYTYSAEIAGLDSLLNRPVSETMTPLCRATFGDANCQKNLTPLTVTGVPHLGGSSVDLIIDTSAIALTEDELQDGIVTAETGPNTGVSRDIRSVDYSTGTITFYEYFPFELVAGDQFTLVAGCNKTFESCKGYNNQINFQGGPTHGNFFPNADWIFSSPSEDD